MKKTFLLSLVLLCGSGLTAHAEHLKSLDGNGLDVTV